ncbi:response regulator, partial [Acinetobacter baumannii]
MPVASIVWVDDEIESLQSQKIFLETKGYSINTFTNGFDALDFIKDNRVDVVLLDESMPGISGLQTL